MTKFALCEFCYIYRSYADFLIVLNMKCTFRKTSSEDAIWMQTTSVYVHVVVIVSRFHALTVQTKQFTWRELELCL